MKKFKQVVSLGAHCFPAIELERINRRPCSLPFDWLITHNFQSVLTLIENHFDGFLEEASLFQMKKYPGYYVNKKYSVDFYHDFSSLKSLDSQLGKVCEKYNRRIERFYQTIEEPTLFLRYLTPQDREFVWQHYEEIAAIIKKFNPQNEIIFVASSDLRMPPADFPVFYVEKAPDEDVAKTFLQSNAELKNYITDNVESCTRKKKSIIAIFRRKVHKLYEKIRIKLNLVYEHSQQC